MPAFLCTQTKVAICYGACYNTSAKARAFYGKDSIRLPWQYLQESHGGVYYEGFGFQSRGGGAV